MVDGNSEHWYEHPEGSYNAATAASARSFAEAIERAGFMRIRLKQREESDGTMVCWYTTICGVVANPSSQTDAYPVLRDHVCQETERP